MGADTVKIFCPKCQCVYHPPPVRSRSSHHGGTGAAGVDGAAFGTTFPHLFLMTFSNLVPDRLPPDSAYVPRVFGFRVHMSARQRASSSLGGSSSTRPREFTDSTKRLGFARRNTDALTKEVPDRKAKDEEGNKAASAQDGAPPAPSQDTNRDVSQKIAKGSGLSSKQQQGTGEENSTKDEDGRKTKAGKRRNDGDVAGKKIDGAGSGSLDGSSVALRFRSSTGALGVVFWCLFQASKG